MDGKVKAEDIIVDGLRVGWYRQSEPGRFVVVWQDDVSDDVRNRARIWASKKAASYPR